MIHFTMIEAWGAIVALLGLGAVIGGGLMLAFGHIWGSMHSSGDSTPCQDFYDRYNALEAENERLREERKYTLSLD